jgi:hypothetical protein
MAVRISVAEESKGPFSFVQYICSVIGTEAIYSQFPYY